MNCVAMGIKMYSFPSFQHLIIPMKNENKWIKLFYLLLFFVILRFQFI